MTGITGATASEVGNAQKHNINTNYVQETNENTTYSNISKHSASTQKKADVYYLNKSKKHEKVFKTYKQEAISSKNIKKSRTNKIATYKPVYSKNNTYNQSVTNNTTCDKSIYPKNIHRQFNSSMADPQNIHIKNQNSTGKTNCSVNHDPLNHELYNMSEYLSPENNNLNGNTSNLTNETAAAGETKYLVQTSNCNVNSPTIKSLAASLTKGKTTTMSKAVAIFNYVRDKIAYSFYYNTKKGAIGTLNSKSGNCVDTTHLLVALMRAAGIPARYAHVKAKFTSGNWYGHVYANVWINGRWYYADATSSKNTLGTIKNWNTKTSTLKGVYASLPF